MTLRFPSQSHWHSVITVMSSWYAGSFSYCVLNSTACVWQSRRMSLITCVRIFTAVELFCITICLCVLPSYWCSHCSVPIYLHTSANLSHSCHCWNVTLYPDVCVSLSVCLSVCVGGGDVFHSGGRTITVTGHGFELVQCVTMQVVGIGQTVSNMLNCFPFFLKKLNHLIRLVGILKSEIMFKSVSSACLLRSLFSIAQCCPHQ